MLSISRRAKAASWQFTALSLGLLAFAGVSAAPQGHTLAVARQRRAVRSTRQSGAARLNSDRLTPQGSSIQALQARLAFLKEWGQEHQVQVKTEDLEAYLFQMQRLAFPNDQVDWTAYRRGVAQRDQLPPAVLGARRPGSVGASALAQSWEYVGPNNLAVPSRAHFGQGVLSGRVNGLAYDPNVSSTYWLAAASGGVWKSTNSGQSWSFLSQSWPALETSCIATHPTDSNTVYVGTGDFPGSGHMGFGLMKTTDGGQTWSNLGKPQFGDFSVSDIIVDPENPQTVIVATGRGLTGGGQVWRSTNGGLSWTASISTPADWSGLSVGALSATGTRNFWAIGGGVAGGELWRSVDRGATWTRSTTSGLGAGVQTGLDVAASRINPDTVYTLSGLDRMIRKSTDAGATFNNSNTGFPNDDQAGDNYNWSQQSYDWHLTTSLNGTNDAVYVGLIDLVMSPDGGATWTSVGGTYGQNALTHDDQHCVAVNPKSPNEILVGNDGGVYRMTYAPASNTGTFATNLNAGLGITQFYTADYDPTDATRMLGGAQDNATPVALGDLSHWRTVCGGTTGAPAGSGCAINPRSPAVQYASAESLNICRTDDSWTTFSDITPTPTTPGGSPWGSDNVPLIGKLAIDPTLDPTRTNFLYAGTNYLWRWNDATRSWTSRLGNQALASGTTGVITSIAVAPNDPSVIYTGASTGEIYVTSNGGTTWARLNQTPTNLPLRSVESIAVHPANPYQILVGLNGTGAAHVWRCLDTRQLTPTWISASGSSVAPLPDSPVNSVIYDPVSPNSRLYVGSDLGVFRSADAGVSWENATAPLNLPNVRVMDLKVAGTGYLMAATYGRGIWRIDPQAIATELTVTSPNGGETLIVNQPTTITWTTQGFTSTHRVKIELSRNSGATFTEVLAASAPDTGSFVWVPQLPTGSSCRIRITSLLDSKEGDVSDADFVIVQGILAVTAPNGGELVRVGQHLLIKWTATGFALTSPNVKVELSRDGGQSYGEVLFDSVSTASGQVDWVVTGPAITRARVRVTAVTVPAFSDASDTDFEIRLPSAVTLQRPNGGERFAAGAPVSLLWNSTGFPGNVRIELTRNGGSSWEVLFPNTPNDGNEDWDATGPATRFGRIRVVSLSESNVLDQSDGVFSIETPSIQVTSPKAGDTLLKGLPATIAWTSTGLAASEAVRLEFSRDGGTLWTSIRASVPNSGQFTFTPNADLSSSCRVRVSAVATDEPSAESGTFNLVAPTLFLVTPNSREKWPLGDQRIIEWSGSCVGTGTVSVELFRNKREGWVTLFEDTPNDGAQAWGVTGALSPKAKIRVIWNSGSGVSLEAESRSTFQIVKKKKTPKRGKR